MITQEISNHTVAVMPQRAVEPYVKTTNGLLIPTSEYSLVPSNEYGNRGGGGGIVVPSNQPRPGLCISKS